MSKENLENEGKQYGTPKRCYVSPVLVCYGQVRDLTQSGTGAVNEINLGPWGCFPNLKKRPCGSDRRIKENLVHIGDHTRSASASTCSITSLNSAMSGVMAASSA